MQTVVLITVIGVWAAVLLPPLMRNRVANRPNSSVSDFRRQLSTLQHSGPTRSMSVRGMARPLAQAPDQSGQRPGSRPSMHDGSLHRTTVQHGGRPGMHHGDVRRAAPQRSHAGHRQAHLHRVSPRELQRRRRTNVLSVLVVATGISGFLAATTKAGPMTWTFGISFVALCGYCYKLAQLRSLEASRNAVGASWYHAA